MRGRTNSGFEIEIEDAKLNDMRVVDAIVDVEDGNLEGTSRLIRLLFTADQKKAFYDHLTKTYGAPKFDMASTELFEILNSSDGEAKNC